MRTQIPSQCAKQTLVPSMESGDSNHLVTVRDCLAEGTVASTDIDTAVVKFLDDAEPFMIASGVYVIFPRYNQATSALRAAVRELILSAQV